MAKYDVVGIGNPLLDLIVEVKDSVLKDLNLEKGRMHLISEKESKQILMKLADHEFKIAPGGSGANVVAGVGCLGGKGFFMGSIGDDDHGEAYEELSETFDVKTTLVRNELPTGHAITFITSDYERTFATFLGSALEFKKKDVVETAIKECKVLHIEGFQFENPDQKDAAIYAMDIAKQHDVIISIDLADSAFIERHLKVLKDVVEKYADIVFVNKREAIAFTGEKDPKKALKKIKEVCELAIITLGKAGSLIMDSEGTYEIPSVKVSEVNTNGAGDMFDSGFLVGYLNGLGIEKAGKIGSFAAAKVVAHTAARLEKSLKDEIENL